MTVFIGADHRGFQLKDILTTYLQDQNIRVEDMGNYSYEPTDDFPVYARKVAEAVLQNPDQHLGIVICGSGVGVSIAANRYKQIYCGLGFDPEQVKSFRAHDHVNVLALAADHLTKEKACELVEAFLGQHKKQEAKYLRRLSQIDEEEKTTNQHV